MAKHLQLFACPGKKNVCLYFRTIPTVPLHWVVMVSSSSEIKRTGRQSWVRDSSTDILTDLLIHVPFKGKTFPPVLWTLSYIIWNAKCRSSEKESCLSSSQIPFQEHRHRGSNYRRVDERCLDTRQATCWEALQHACTNWCKHIIVSQNHQLLTIIFSSSRTWPYSQGLDQLSHLKTNWK